MNDWQQKVGEFHDAMELPTGSDPWLQFRLLRARLVMEEAVETAKALGFEVFVSTEFPFEGDAVRLKDLGDAAVDTVEVIDGLCDVIYVAAGAAVTMGVDLDPFFAEVHRSNMAKVGGEVRDDGKRLKPPGWTPPDIRGVLRATGCPDRWHGPDSGYWHGFAACPTCRSSQRETPEVTA